MGEIRSVYRIFATDIIERDNIKGKEVYWRIRVKCNFESKSKGKFVPRTGYEGPEGEQRYGSTLSLMSALDGGGWLSPLPGRCTP